MRVFVHFSVGVPAAAAAAALTCMQNEWAAIKDTLLALFFFLFFLGHICVAVPDAKINAPHVIVEKMQRECLRAFG